MSADTSIKPELRYTKEHEWVRLEGDVLVVGITAFAVSQLGDITLVDFDAEPDAQVSAGDTFGTIESVKTLSDLFAPVSGTLLEVNPKLEDAPELVNEDCWGSGWMIKLKCSNPADVEQLLDANAYAALVAESEH